MRSLMILISAVGCAAIARAQSAPVATSAGSSRVWVAPFTEADNQHQPDWISRALRQSVADDLAASRGLNVLPLGASTTQPAGSEYVVDATIQRIDGELRVTGRIVDSDSGKIVGGFKATGNEQNLFGIEDAISGQLKDVLVPAKSAAPANNPNNPAAPVAANVPAPRGSFDGSDLQRALDDRDFVRRLAERNAEVYQPQPQQPYTYTQPTYPYTYGIGGSYYPPNYWGGGYGGYGYGWGWGTGTSVIIIGNQGRNGHGRWNGGDGGHWNNNGGGGGGTPNNNGQDIRRVSSWMGNAPPVITHTSTGPPLVPAAGGAPTLVPRSAPQLVPSAGGAPTLVPHGGPQLVPGGQPNGGAGRH